MPARTRPQGGPGRAASLSRISGLALSGREGRAARLGSRRTRRRRDAGVDAPRAARPGPAVGRVCCAEARTVQTLLLGLFAKRQKRGRMLMKRVLGGVALG